MFLIIKNRYILLVYFEIKMPNKQMAQRVIDFQYSRIRAINDEKRKTTYQYGRFSNRYSNWNLNQLIDSLSLQQKSYNTLWVGYGHPCLLQAFLYCLIQGCKYAKEDSNMQFIKTKYCLYELAEKYLTLKQQKQLVENLCYAQYARSIVSFINKTHNLQELISKIYKGFVQDGKQNALPLEKLKYFASNFSFLQFYVINDSIALMTHLEQKYYIISQKQCIFIIDLNNRSEMISQVTSNALSNQIHLFKTKIETQENNVDGQISNQQLSTPKFIRNSQFKISTNRSTNKVFYENKNNKDNSKNFAEVSLFQEQSVPNIISISEVTSSHQQVQEEKNNSLQKQQVQLPNQAPKSPKTPISSLRNTIDMHIQNLKQYGHRNKKPKNKSYAFNKKIIGRQKSPNKNITNQIIPQIIKSKSQQHNRSLSPKQTAQLAQTNFFHHLGMGYNSGYLSPHSEHRPIYPNSFRNSITSRHRVSFTYNSP